MKPQTIGSPERDEVTCPACISLYESYKATLGEELGKFARGEHPYPYVAG